MLEIEKNQNLEYAVRRDLSQIQSCERTRWQYKRGSWRPSVVRSVSPIKPEPAGPGPSPVPSPASGPSKAVGTGQIIYLKAFISGVDSPTTKIVMSDWFSMRAYIAHIEFSVDINDTEADGIRLYVTDSPSVPENPPISGALELIQTTSSADYEAPYASTLLRVPGSPGGREKISTPCHIIIPFARWRICAYYYINSPIATDQYSAHIIFDVCEQVANTAGGGLAEIPYNPPVEYASPIISVAQPEVTAPVRYTSEFTSPIISTAPAKVTAPVRYTTEFAPPIISTAQPGVTAPVSYTSEPYGYSNMPLSERITATKTEPGQPGYWTSESSHR